jgi:hypothetical protein
VALVLLVVGALGCGGGTTTPTAPTVPPLAPVAPAAQSSCSPPTVGRVHTVPVPGLTTPASAWLESTSPPYTVTYRQVTPPGYTVAIEWSLVSGAEALRGFTLLSAGGCGFGSFRSQVTGSAGPRQLRVRIWVRPGQLASPFTPAGPPDYDATEPLDWTVVS